MEKMKCICRSSLPFPISDIWWPIVELICSDELFMQIKFTPTIDHRSMEHHYTESLGHRDDIKFYPPVIWWPIEP